MNKEDTIEFWCGEGRHTSCLHVPYDSVQWTVEPTDTAEPPRVATMAKRPYAVRDTSSVPLCRCPCHLECPLTRQEYGNGWLDVCDCLGTLHFLKGQAHGDLGSELRASLDESRRKRLARQELRRRARGLQPDEVEGLLDVVWAEHGLAAPVAPFRPALVEWAMGRTSPLDRARTSADLLEGTARWVGGIAKLFRGAIRDEEVPRLHEENDFVIEPGHDSVEVELDAAAQRRLMTMGDPPLFTSRTMTSLLVLLREGSSRSIEVWDRAAGPASVAGPIGTVPAAQAQTFHRWLSAATRVGQSTIGHATRTSTASGGSRLYVKVPLSRDDLDDR